MTEPALPPGYPHWVKFWVDGGTLGAPPTTRGVYWSMRCEDGSDTTALVRRQDTDFRTNNDAEWLAVREALLYAAQNHPELPVVIYSDSRLIVNQFNGVWRAKIARHHRLRTECKMLAERCKFVVVQWNSRVMSVAKLGH